MAGGRRTAIDYPSKQAWGQLPVVHISVGGRQADGRYRLGRARGIIALGDIAIGLVAVGGVAIGLLSVGGVALGLVAVGAVAVGLAAVEQRLLERAAEFDAVTRMHDLLVEVEEPLRGEIVHTSP